MSVNEFNWIHVLHVDHALNTTTLTVMDSNATIASNLAISSVGAQYELVNSFEFCAFRIDNKLYVVNSTSMSFLWNYTYTLPATFKNIHLLYPWLFFYDTQNLLSQYHVPSGTLYDMYTPAATYSYIISFFSNSSFSYFVYFLNSNTTLSYMINVNDEYRCIPLPCACKPGYTSTGTTCLATVATTVNTVMNKPIPTLVYVPAQPNTTAISTYCFTPPSPNSPASCNQFCSERCSGCSSTAQSCVECSQFYTLSSDGQSCDISTFNMLVVMVYVVSNSFKSSRMLTLFAFLHNFNLYNYHRIQYQGVLQ